MICKAVQLIIKPPPFSFPLRALVATAFTPTLAFQWFTTWRRKFSLSSFFIFNDVPTHRNSAKTSWFSRLYTVMRATRRGTSHLYLLLSILGRVLAALALPAQLLQLALTLLQTFPFTLVFHLVFLQSSLRGRQRADTITSKNHKFKALVPTNLQHTRRG